jgi:hypothetical protein
LGLSTNAEQVHAIMRDFPDADSESFVNIWEKKASPKIFLPEKAVEQQNKSSGVRRRISNWGAKSIAWKTSGNKNSFPDSVSSPSSRRSRSRTSDDRSPSSRKSRTNKDEYDNRSPSSRRSRTRKSDEYDNHSSSLTLDDVQSYPRPAHTSDYDRRPRGRNSSSRNKSHTISEGTLHSRSRNTEGSLTDADSDTKVDDVEVQAWRKRKGSPQPIRNRKYGITFADDDSHSSDSSNTFLSYDYLKGFRDWYSGSGSSRKEQRRRSRISRNRDPYIEDNDSIYSGSYKYKKEADFDELEDYLTPDVELIDSRKWSDRNRSRKRRV